MHQLIYSIHLLEMLISDLRWDGKFCLFVSDCGSKSIIKLDKSLPKGAIFMAYCVLSLNSMNLICMHRCLLEIQGKNFN